MNLEPDYNLKSLWLITIIFIAVIIYYVYKIF